MNEIIYDLLISGISGNFNNISKTIFKSALDKMIDFAVKIKPQLKSQIKDVSSKDEAGKIMIEIKDLINFNTRGCESILSEAEFKAFETIFNYHIGKINIDPSKFSNSKLSAQNKSEISIKNTQIIFTGNAKIIIT